MLVEHYTRVLAVMTADPQTVAEIAHRSELATTTTHDTLRVLHESREVDWQPVTRGGKDCVGWFKV